MQTALSITVHESPETIVDQCLNNVIVGEFDWIAIHVNQTSALDLDDLRHRLDNVDRLRGRVFVNPHQCMTDWCEPGLLHRAHIANFHFLKSIGSFDSFAMDGSNSLLVCRGLKAYMAAHAYGTDSISAFGWGSSWEDSLRRDFLFEMIGGACRRGHVEGLFMRTGIFEEVVQWCGMYEARYEQAVSAGVQPVSLPREEYLFVTALDQLGYPPKGANYVVMRHASDLAWYGYGDRPGEWKRVRLFAETTMLSWKEFEIRRSLDGDKLWPFYWDMVANHLPPVRDMPTYQAGKFGVKRVARELDDPIRKMVGEHFGYRGESQSAI